VLPDDMTKNSSLPVCPVPSEQLPLNQYEELRESWYFRWATLDFNLYTKKMVWLWAWSLLIMAPVAAASFPIAKFPAKFLLTSTGGGILIVILALLRLYLGWAHVSSRLADTAVVYEESGWYDGQIWTKPVEVLTRDRLVVSYQIQPLLKRMQATLGVLTGTLMLGAIAWKFL